MWTVLFQILGYGMNGIFKFLLNWNENSAFNLSIQVLKWNRTLNDPFYSTLLFCILISNLDPL